MMAYRIMLMAILVFGSVQIIVPTDVKASNDVIFSDPALDGEITGSDGNYATALSGAGTLDTDTTATMSFIGQTSAGFPLEYYIYRTYLSFDTSGIPEGDRLVSATLNVMAHNSTETIYNIRCYQADYGTSLENGDWGTVGTLMDSICTTQLTTGWQPLAFNVNVTDTGRTQFILNASIEGTPPPFPYYPETVSFLTGDHVNPPYLSVTTVTESEAIITYNFTAPGMTNWTANIYPVEYIDWQNQDLIRYEFWNMNQSWIHLEMPDDNYSYLSINPFANVTQIDTTTYNITNTWPNECFYWIWFTINKSLECPAHISMYREVTGKGILWETWPVYFNEGIWTDEGNMTRVYSQDMKLVTGTAYCFSVYDYFPTPNFITNYTIIASPGANGTMFVDIPVPYSPLNFKSFREDTTAFRIWYEAAGNPFQDHVPGGEWYQMDIRGGQYMIAIDYLDTTPNGTASILETTFFNITANSSVAYTINIEEGLINVIYTTVDGIEIDINTFLRKLTPGLTYEFDNGCYAPTEDECYGEMGLVHLDPYWSMTATIRMNGTGTGTLYTGLLDENEMSGTYEYLEDTLVVSSTNTTAQLYVNDTDTVTELFNVSAPSWSEYDILTDHFTSRGNNLSVETTGGTFSFTRRIKFRFSLEFGWIEDNEIQKIRTVVTINNTLGHKLIEPHIIVPFYNGTHPDLMTFRMYDMDNHAYVDPGGNYTLDFTGVKFMFTSLADNEQKVYRFHYFRENATYFDIGVIYPELDPQWYEFRGEDYRYVFGEFRNEKDQTFLGSVKFVLNIQEAVDIDPTSVRVIDLDHNELEIPDGINTWWFTGNSVEFDPDFIEDIGPGERRSFGVLYLKTGEDITDVLTDPVVGPLSLPVLGGIIAIVFIVIGLVLRAREKNKDEGTGSDLIRIGSAILLCIGSFIGLVILIAI